MPHCVSGYNWPRLFWLPEGADFEQFGENADVCRWTTNVVTRKLAHDDIDDDGAVRINTLTLRRVTGSRVNTCKMLCEAGILETDGSYRAGARSKAYTLGPEYLGRKIVFSLPTDNAMIFRIHKEFERIDEENKRTWLPEHNRLDAMQREYLTLSPEAEHVVESLPRDDERDYRRVCQGALVRAIRDRQFHASVHHGRFFNSITSLKKEIRNHCMRIAGEPTVNLDICCAQPALLGLLMYKLQKQERSGVAAVMPKNVVSKLPSKLPTVDGAEMQHYLGVVQGGVMYAEILEALGWPESRAKEVKRGFLRDVLAKKGSYPSAIEETFRSRFPTVHRFVKAVNDGSHSRLIVMLQEMEGFVMYGHVTPLCDFPIVTLHDGIYCRANDIDELRVAFHEGFGLSMLRASFK